MTVSKPLRFMLQIVAFFFILVGGYDAQMKGDFLGGLTMIVLGAAAWFVSRRKTAT